MLAGMIVGAWKLIPGRRYGVAMIVEGCLLGSATRLFLHKHRLALPAVSMACGLQNAMSSSYCGLMIRTTHVTGIVTDIGVMLGHWLRTGRSKAGNCVSLCGLFLHSASVVGSGNWLVALWSGVPRRASHRIYHRWHFVGLYLSSRAGGFGAKCQPDAAPPTSSFPNIEP